MANYAIMFPIGNEDMAMSTLIDTVETLGRLIRTVRIAQGFTRDELANATGFSPKFISQVESGKATAQIGRVLQLLDELGIRLQAGTSTVLPQETDKTALRRRRQPGAQ
jgi:transcriptional regulator with XRE-family HTH domain